MVTAVTASPLSKRERCSKMKAFILAESRVRSRGIFAFQHRFHSVLRSASLCQCCRRSSTAGPKLSRDRGGSKRYHDPECLCGSASESSAGQAVPVEPGWADHCLLQARGRRLWTGIWNWTRSMQMAANAECFSRVSSSTNSFPRNQPAIRVTWFRLPRRRSVFNGAPTGADCFFSAICKSSGLMQRHFRRRTSFPARNRSPTSSFLQTGARPLSCAATICGLSKPPEAPHGPSRGMATETLRKGELDWLYPAELGTKHGYAWSPDSSRIAYLEFNLTGVASYTPPFQLAEDPPAPTIDYPTPGTTIPQVRAFVVKVNGKSPAVAIDTGTERMSICRDFSGCRTGNAWRSSD